MGSEDEAFSSGAQEGGLPQLLPPNDAPGPRSRSRSSISSHEGAALELDTMKEVGVEVPSHPIPSMQAAFAESMLESSAYPASRPYGKDATTRRQILLDQAISEETHAARWRLRPGQQYHQLWKLMAQISFGIYLLLNGIAKDDEQVMTILQGHVDEVDEFLETTMDDFDLATHDIDDRLRLLKLPLDRIETFDAMLQDRPFRLQIVNGNEKIEHVITRTAAAMNDALKDVQQGVNACREFTVYLREEEHEVWKEERPEMEKVYEAMKGNVDGWYKAYVSLQTKGNHLGVALVQLGSIVAEMDRRAGEVSRKTRFSFTPESSPISPAVSTRRRPSQQMRQSMLKNLPSDPNMITPAISATLPAFQLVEDRERSPEPVIRENYLDLDDSDDEAERDVDREEKDVAADYILAPRTYTPLPSPSSLAPPVQPVQPASPPPEKQRLSLRKRISLKRADDLPEAVGPATADDDGYWGPRKPVYSVSENAQRPRGRPAMGYNERSLLPITVPSAQELEAVDGSPSRGVDSAYCSDPEKPIPAPSGPHPSTFSPSYFGAPYVPDPPRLTTTAPNPRSSAQQSYLPINASPNSPLQRPWTAAPPNHHAPPTPSSSRFQPPAPPDSRLSHNRVLPSAMGHSTMSGTSMSSQNGNKLKKKRSALGWLKKAFALDEDEKMAFEQRKTKAAYDASYYNEPPKQKWLDGRRIR